MRYRHWLALAVAGGALLPMGAHAQSSPPNRTGTVEEVVVTARRRAENIQNVPASIEAFSGKTLQQYTIQTLSDLSQVAPGLTVQPSVFGKGPLTLSIRGQRQSLANISYDQPVSVYFDEVLQARSQGLDDAFFDLSSVQVLKGPQGTLFGRNTTGGALLISSQAPTKNFEGYLDGTFGNYNLAREEAAVNLPLGDALQVRLAGVVTRRDGYINDPAQGDHIDDANTNSWRASIRFSPTDKFRNDLVLNGFNEDDSAVAYKLTSVVPGSYGVIALPDLSYYGSHDFWTSNTTAPPDGSRIHTLAAANISTLDLGGLTLKNIFGYRQVRSDIYFDLDGSSAFVASSQDVTHEQQFSNETQVLGSALNKDLEYVAGVYWFKETGDEVQTTDILSPTSPNNLVTAFSVVSQTEAVYAQATYHFPMLTGLSFTAGGRYTWDQRTIDAYSHFSSGVCRLVTADTGGVPLSPCFREANASFASPTYNLSLDWKINEKNLVYFTQRRGYQAGGFTNSALAPSEFIPYRPETVMDYELGLKSRWSFGSATGQTDIALFRGDYTDIQRLETIYLPNPGGIPSPINRILNAATSTVQGIDLDFRFRPVNSVELTVGYTYLNAKYNNFIVAGANYTNSNFAGAPEHTFSGSARFHLPVPAEIGDAHVEVNGSYQSWTVTQDTTSFNPVTQANFPTSILPGYGTINARFDLADVGGKPIRLSAFVRNITNAKYYVGGNDGSTGLGVVTLLLGAPRTFGVELNYSF
jgi:iron complex outermembrane receptor protein